MDSSGELMGFMNGGRVERRDRQVAAPAKRIHDEVREAAFKADGAATSSSREAPIAQQDMADLPSTGSCRRPTM